MNNTKEIKASTMAGQPKKAAKLKASSHQNCVRQNVKKENVSRSNGTAKELGEK